MTITVQDLFSKIDPSKMQFMQANSALMALNIGSKKTPPNATIAMPVDVISSLMHSDETSVSLVVIAVERKEWEKAVKEAMAESERLTEGHQSAE